MSARIAAWLAWSLWAVAVTLRAVDLLLAQVNGHPRFMHQALASAASLSFPTVGAVIVSRHPAHLIGWLFCAPIINFVGHLASEYARYTLVTAPGSLPGGTSMAWLGEWTTRLGFEVAFSFTFLLFPNGKLPSRAWRPVAWLTAGVVTLHTIREALKPGPMYAEYLPDVRNPLGVDGLGGIFVLVDRVTAPLFVAMALVNILAPIVRFRHSTGAERQQLKWVAYGAGLVAVFGGFGVALGASPAAAHPLVILAAAIVGFVPSVAFPISIGIAILRYQLFEIDIVINRTLVYGTLSVSLVLIYWGSVVLLQQALRPFTQGSDLAIAGSTLAVAAAFQPLRRHIQETIDRRFYRRKYDAAQTLAAFGARLRQETDLDDLRADLVAVVQETMQPASASLWLRPAVKAAGIRTAASSASGE